MAYLSCRGLPSCNTPTLRARLEERLGTGLLGRSSSSRQQLAAARSMRLATGGDAEALAVRRISAVASADGLQQEQDQ